VTGRTKLIGVIGTVLAGALLAFLLLNSQDFSAEDFDRVERGLTQAEVEELIGEPDAVQDDPLPSSGSTEFEQWIYISEGNFYTVSFSDGVVALTDSRPCLDDGSCDRERDALPEIDDR